MHSVQTHIGFSLLEMLLALAIVATLVALGTNAYDSVRERIQTLDGHNKQLEIMQRQHAYFAQHRRYTLSLKALGFDVPGAVIMSDQKHFRILAKRCGTRPLNQCVRLQAKPITPKDNNVLILDSNTDSHHKNP